VSVFAESDVSIAASMVALGMVAIVVASTAVIWAVGGAAIDRILRGDRARRAIGVVLGVLLAGSVVFLWI